VQLVVGAVAVVVGAGLLSGCAIVSAPSAEGYEGRGSGDLDGDRDEPGTGGPAAGDHVRVASVVMIGDSITEASRSALHDDFAQLGFESVVIEAESGKRMARALDANPSGTAIARFLADPERDHADEVWVVALGTNDVGNYSRPDEIAAAVNEVLAAVPDAAPLVWVDVHLPRRPEVTEQFNSIVRERLARRANSAIAPWSLVARAEGVMSNDAVHPTTAGTEVFAAVVAETVRTFLGR
jgi:lysophospholipase L1-like esterase